MSLDYSLESILKIVGESAECVGASDRPITGIASLKEAEAGDLSFLGNSKYTNQVSECRASIILVPLDYLGSPQPKQLFLKVENPSLALALICRDIEFSLSPRPPAGIHPTACVEPDAQVDASAAVGPFCYVGAGATLGANVVLESHVSIGKDAVIGNDSHLFPQVVVAPCCIIGDRNRLLQGSIIGADGYGYEQMDGVHQRVPQIGNVVTEADVDVGANSTIDRARFGSTRIGRGTKIDNLVQVAHNVQIGKHALLVAQCGVSGSTEIGNNVILAGQSGVTGHVKIADGTLLYAKSGAMSSTKPNDKISGTHGQEAYLMNRIYVLQRKLPELFKRFELLEKYVESLKNDNNS